MSSGLDASIYQTLGKTFQRAQIGAGSVPFSQGNTVSIELPNALLQRYLVLNLTGNLVVGVANASSIFAEAPWGLIKNIRIVGDGRRVLINSPARDLWRLAQLVHGHHYQRSAPTALIGTNAFSGALVIDQEMLLAINPVESLFDPRLFKKVTIEITWGAAADIANPGGGGTIAISGCSVDVLVDQTSEGVNEILFDHELSPDEQAVTATSSLFQFKVPQNGLLAGMLLRTDRTGATGPIPVDDIIANMSLKSDTTVAHVDQVSWSTLQKRNVGEYQFASSQLGSVVTGYAYLPLLENGMISSALNTNALNDLRLILSVVRTSDTEIVHVTYDWLVPRRSLAQAVA
jgi:hypothetical protein